MLLRGEHDSEVLRSHLAFPALDSAEQLVVVLGRISSSAKPQSDALETASQALSRALLTGRASPLVAVRTGTVVAVAPVEAGASVPQRLHRVHAELRKEGTQFLCGLSGPRSGVAGIPGGFDQAALALSCATAERPVVSLSELPVMQSLLLGTTSTMRSVLAAQAREIDLDGRDPLPMMRETLQAFGEADMNVTRTARALHVHPNTLRYRLRRIRERTGRDPHSFSGLVDLICLVTLLSEAGQDGDAPAAASPSPEGDGSAADRRAACRPARRRRSSTGLECCWPTPGLRVVADAVAGTSVRSVRQLGVRQRRGQVVLGIDRAQRALDDVVGHRARRPRAGSGCRTGRAAALRRVGDLLVAGPPAQPGRRRGEPRSRRRPRRRGLSSTTLRALRRCRACRPRSAPATCPSAGTT